MKECIEQTIGEVDGKIAALTALRENLVAQFGEERGTTPAAALDRAFKKMRRQPAGEKAPRRTPEEMLAIGRGLPSPVTVDDLEKATGMTRAGAGSQIVRWTRLGYLKRLGYGKYERTAKFPKGEAAAAAAEVKTLHAPGLDGDGLSLEQRLENALRERDAAVAAGRENLAKILQDKVNKLQGLLEQ